MPLEPKLKRKILIATAGLVAMVAALTLTWRFTPLKDMLTVENIAAWFEAASTSWWMPIAVVAVYTPAALILFPRALITLAAAIVFGPLKGFILAMAGVLLSAWILHAAGARVQEKTVRRIAGPRIEPVKRMLKKQGFMAIAALGFLPVAPFSVEMLIAGALRVPLLHLLAGVAIAHLPGTIFTTLLGDQAMAAMTQGREVNRFVVAGVVIAFVALAIWTRRWWQRMQAQMA